ncbi:Stp1/IreP family PP2C-type Ser/Thr phosphatase [Jeotgalibacillus sp. S-D1]|uniref:Stp1/IreP family PP2C-type Ser/Thr phosphatase n=1 Tax=Jeotgalibacillus sp. S-D1 TaxID=2552189 RepID=UPI001059AA73|nr:Stp1/IreP family PP2C-type Ser/Thr phosphatase [Jeotgalibacillus sp. S-D1]TDL35085.1 Stp1/IreP family PP2C-type Ser/Thr phosphatase [Jeotgalibacillus sp. S-D1]
MQFAFVSDQGKVRRLNEDAGGVFLHPQGHILAVVADGMGGHRAGDVASSMAVEKIENLWMAAPIISKPTDAEKWLIASIEEINHDLNVHAAQYPDCEGMGTTIVVAICTQEFVTLGNVGDSRGYIVAEKRIRQVTEDHSFVNALVQSGEISESDAEHHPKKNWLLKSLGAKGPVKPSITTITVDHGNIVFLCSDGMSNKITEQRLMEILLDKSPMEERARQLVNIANENGGEDNITIAMVEYLPVGESEEIK